MESIIPVHTATMQGAQSLWSMDRIWDLHALALGKALNLPDQQFPHL